MPPRKLKRSVSADVEGRPSKAPAEIAVSGLDSEPAEAAGASKEAGDAGDAGDVKISRFANQDLVRDVVIGYTGDEDEDPPQAGSSKERHNRDVQQMISEGLDVPIAKDQRSSYVWVAASKVPENQGVEGNIEMRKKKYTWNPEEIQPVDAVRSKQLRCDICGALCTEVLYEFRCYKRMRPDEPRSVGRRLHPFVSYISKECGQGLLGNPSGASKLRERIYRLLMDTDGLSAVEELEEVWRLGNETMRQPLASSQHFAHFPCGVAWARVMKDSTPSHEHGDVAQNAASDPEAFTAITAPGKTQGTGAHGHGGHGGHGAHVSEVSAMSVISETVAEIREAGVVLLSSLCLVSVLEGADMALLPAVFYALQTDLGLSLSDLATMTLIQGVTTSAVAPFWGILADRGIMKRKHIIVMGCVLQGLVTMLLSVIDSMVGMTMLRALNGALLASLRPVASGIIADVTSEQRRGKVYGVVQFCTNCGLMAGGLIGTPLSTKTVLGWQGWRVAFIGIGSLSVLVGIFAACTMTEPARETSGAHVKDRGAMRQELRKLLSYFRMPTFCALIFQGWFGGIPWNAMGYATLFYQVGGLDDAKAAILSSMGQASGAFGGLLGGLIGDRLARCCPLHGRPLTAQISVLAGIPVAYLTFMMDPPAGEAAFFYYMGLVTFLGLTATWCGVGVNLPILTEIVRPEGRSTILAWESALESTFACILGNAMVGFLAEKVFGYRLDNSDHARADVESRRALGKALTLTCFTPWLICWVVYSLLHWSYPKDLKRVKNEKLKDKKEAYLQRKREKAEEARKANEAMEKTEEPEVESEAVQKHTIICTNVDGTTMSPMSSPVAI